MLTVRFEPRPGFVSRGDARGHCPRKGKWTLCSSRRGEEVRVPFAFGGACSLLLVTCAAVVGKPTLVLRVSTPVRPSWGSVLDGGRRTGRGACPCAVADARTMGGKKDVTCFTSPRRPAHASAVSGRSVARRVPPVAAPRRRPPAAAIVTNRVPGYG